MKKWMIGIILTAALSSLAGSLGLPVERVALGNIHNENPNVKHLVCIWDDSSKSWSQEHQTYDNSGIYQFQVPEWDTWYWVGLWDTKRGEYVFGEWICHFK